MQGTGAAGQSRISISKGLEGRDDEIEDLHRLFEELQLSSADIANPELPFLTFVESAYYFGVITEVPSGSSAEDSEGPDLGANPNPLEPDSAASEELDRLSNLDFHPTTVDENENLWGQYDDHADDRNSWPPQPKSGPIVGIVYLATSQEFMDYLRNGELSIGIIILEKYRKKGYAREAVKKVLDIAFADPSCHRIQAVLINSPGKNKALSMLMKSGFGHEGTRRRAFYSPYDGEFKDVTYLGILATDWVIRTAVVSVYKIAPSSLWDELFARHQREREELLRWEEKSLKRTISTETIREGRFAPKETIDLGAPSDFSDFSVSSSPRTKRRRVESDANNAQSPGSGRDETDAPLAEPEPEPEGSNEAHLTIDWIKMTQSPDAIPFHLAPREDSPTFSDNSEIGLEAADGYSSSVSSDWDVIETSSNSSLSDIDYNSLSIDDLYY